MGVGVDETGGDREFGHIEGLCRGGGGAVADYRDATSDDSDIGPHGSRAGAVDHRAVEECKIKIHTLKLASLQWESAPPGGFCGRPGMGCFTRQEPEPPTGGAPPWLLINRATHRPL